MSLFDALNTANQAMHVHRYRSEIAAENLAHAYSDPNYQRKVVQLGAGSNFSTSLNNARSARAGGHGTDGAATGAIYVSGVTRERSFGSERGNAMMDTLEMMRSKSAYELNVRVASMARSMAMAALEIGRGA